ncbi:MAG TPA: hypothetical protein VLR26_02195, partial [Frankiaceae bacterium]|nr:hypothetical protein [Frankiaceae bacterium]
MITELAAVVVNARAALGGDSPRAGNQLGMAEMDLLSARDAIEKACWEIDLAFPAAADVRWPAGSASPVPPQGGGQTVAVDVNDCDPGALVVR